MNRGTRGNHGQPTNQLVLALFCGVLCGIFFGEYTANLKLLGDAYVGLLQMTVLPYILFSLIGNIGKLNRTQASLLMRSGLKILLLLWGLAGLLLIAMALALPNVESGAFFSASLLQPAPDVDLLALFIPANLFRALADNAVPAVVVFCLMFGAALMENTRKGALLPQLEVVVQVLHRVNAMVLRLTPLGIFAIVASAAGSFSLQDFARLQAYVVLMTTSVVLLALWVYPLLISVCTPIRWQDVLVESRDAVITAFVLGSIFAVIPLLIDSVNRMLATVGVAKGQQELGNTPALVLPVVYPFPDAGKVLTLLFVPFAAWFYGHPLPLGEFGMLLSTGLVVLFGKVVNAVPFLLDLFEVPSDIFQLFLASGLLMGRIADIAAAMYLIAFATLSSAMLNGFFKLNWPRLAKQIVLLSLAIVLLVTLLHNLLYRIYQGSYQRDDVLQQMQLMDRQVTITVLEQPGPNPVPLASGLGHGERIRQRGVLRVGYVADQVPFSFVNEAGELVGFDIALAQELAVDLGVAVEFVPYQPAGLANALAADHFDVAVSGITATTQKAGLTLFSEPYLYVNMALVVADHRKRDFADERHIRAQSQLRIGVQVGSYFAARAQEHFPGVQFVALTSERDFFTSPDLDALLTTAEGGASWTLAYPAYTAINPLDSIERAPLVLAIPFDMEIEEYLELWIELQRLDGTIDQLFDYWILGRTDVDEKPRWSVIRDVLHWVD